MIRDKADISIYLQNEGAESRKSRSSKRRSGSLTRFPDLLIVEDDPAKIKPEDKWYNLKEYDVILAFDPNWTKVSAEAIAKLRTWVDLQAGGLLLVAGPIHTKVLAMPDMDNKYDPLLSVLPVELDDPSLMTARRPGLQPFRLEFENISPDTDYMRLDDENQEDPLAGWEPFFTGKDKKDEKSGLKRGFHSIFPVKQTKGGVASVVARFGDPAAKMADGKLAPWLVTMKYGQGSSAFMASGEVWRLLQYKQVYFERFWTKLIRYLAAGRRKQQNVRGRILMSREVQAPGTLPLNVQLLDPQLQPVEKKAEPKAWAVPVELDTYSAGVLGEADPDKAARAKDKYHLQFRKDFRLSAKPGAGEWKGDFQRRVQMTAEQYPPGTWRLEVEIPNSTETLKQKFTIRRSNPELDQTRPDFDALAKIAGDLEEVTGRLTDKGLAGQLKDASAKTPEGTKLFFKFENRTALDLIPQVIDRDSKTLRNRGAVEDRWDKGVDLPEWLTDWTYELRDMTPHPVAIECALPQWSTRWYDRWYDREPRTYYVGFWLAVVALMLSLEWLTRKLLKLA